MTEVEISPRSWEYRLVAAVVFPVDQRAGGTAAAPRTRWTGLLLEETDPDLLGTAGDDGSMSVSIANVLEPLRKARDLDRPLTGGEALELRDAMGTPTRTTLRQRQTTKAAPRTGHTTISTTSSAMSFRNAGLNHISRNVAG